MIDLVRVETEDAIHSVAGLADEIWNEYFPGIISQAQVDYMVEKFQSSNAIRAQLTAGYQYYLLDNGRANVGYIALLPHNRQEGMQISKFYILKHWRQHGIARQVLMQVMEISRIYGFTRIFLTVNKFNQPSISAYEKTGFTKTGELTSDIGSGYVMDDYVMEIAIPG